MNGRVAKYPPVMRGRQGIQGGLGGLSARKDATGGKAVDAGAAWHRDIGSIIENLGNADLLERLVEALDHLVPSALAAVFVYRGRARPLLIYDNFRPDAAKKGLALYIESTYVVNPFYQAYLTGIADGVYRMRDLAPDSVFVSQHHKTHGVSASAEEEIGFVTENWPVEMEELEIAVTLEGNCQAEITLSRPRHDGFDDADVARVSAVFPVIAAVMRRHWKECGAGGSKAPPPDSRVDDAFANFGADLLSRRECEVTQLILRGHSSESIGGNLGISLGTVKTHRKNAYAKLRISSQSELLSLFLRSLTVVA